MFPTTRPFSLPRLTKGVSALVVIATIAACLGCAAVPGNNNLANPSPQSQAARPGTGSSITNQFVYTETLVFDPVTSVESATLSPYRIESDGSLAKLATNATLLDSRVTLSLLFPDPTNGSWVIAVAPTAILTYRVQSQTGALHRVATTIPPNNQYATGAAVNPQGTRLFVAVFRFSGDSTVDSILTYAIGPSGRLTLLATSPISQFVRGMYILNRFAFDPAGRHMYVLLGDYEAIPREPITVAEFGIDATTGAVTQLNAYTDLQDIGGGARSLVMHPSGKFLYVALQDPEVAVYSVNATTGALTRTQVQSCDCGISAPLSAEIEMNAIGTLLFQNTGGEGIAVYSVAAGGALAPIPSSFVRFSYSFVLDGSGSFLYSSYVPEEGIVGLATAADGVLTPVPGSPFALPSGQYGVRLLLVTVRK